MLLWSDALATRNVIIDAEHRQLLEFLNVISSATPEQKGRAYSHALIHGLYRQTAGHFAHEELLMAEFHYDATDRHTAVHAAMLAQFRAMLEALDDLGVEVVAGFVEQWISGHLLGEDLALARHLQQNQRTGGAPGEVGGGVRARC